LPRPPSPREFLEFADEVAIPATIAILEANIKLLEALQRAIRLADKERAVREGSKEARDRATDLGVETVDRLDSALSDLQRAIEDGPLPDDEDARDVLSEARSLRDRLDERVRDATEQADAARNGGSATEIDINSDEESEADEDVSADEVPDDEDEDPPVDVDSELEYLKDEYGEESDGAASGEDTGEDDDGKTGAAESSS
jgi:small-conductance mechanosensitive channel